MSYIESDYLPPLMPRRLKINSLVLDLFHRDACYDDRWLGLYPREFEVLWRLAESQGQTLNRKVLLKTVWRLQHDPQTNRVQVAIARIRAKLAPYGMDDVIETVAGRGYRITAKVDTPDIAPDTLGPKLLDKEPLDASAQGSYLTPNEAGLVVQNAGGTNDPTGKWKSFSRTG